MFRKTICVSCSNRVRRISSSGSERVSGPRGIASLPRLRPEIPRVRPARSAWLRYEQGGHHALRFTAAHFDLGAVEQAHVDLAADPESIRQVDARLDGKAR